MPKTSRQRRTALTPDAAALRSSLRKCSAQLSRAARIATYTADGWHPVDGAVYVLGAIKALRSDLAILRGTVRRRTT